MSAQKEEMSTGKTISTFIISVISTGHDLLRLVGKEGAEERALSVVTLRMPGFRL